MNGVATGDWFFTVEGEQKGPVSGEELAHLAEAGAIHPRNDMVWQSGMESWVTAGELDGLFQRRDPNEQVEERSQMAATATNPAAADPHAASQASDEISDFEYYRTAEWPGFGRGSYFLATVVLPIVGQFALAFLAMAVGGMLGENGPAYVSLAGSLAIVALVIYGVLQRFPNLGMSRWWVLGLLVPILNWWVSYRCIACPPGYAYHKKLDTIGWVLAVLYWLSVVVALVVTVAMFVMMGAMLLEVLQNPESLNEIIKESGAGG